jgi:hypothetical protein
MLLRETELYTIKKFITEKFGEDILSHGTTVEHIVLYLLEERFKFYYYPTEILLKNVGQYVQYQDIYGKTNQHILCGDGKRTWFEETACHTNAATLLVSLSFQTPYWDSLYDDVKKIIEARKLKEIDRKKMEIEKAKAVLKEAGYLMVFWHENDIRETENFDDAGEEAPLTDLEVYEVKKKLENLDASIGVNWSSMADEIYRVTQKRKSQN